MITFVMTEESKRAFADLSSRNVGKPVEIRIDGRVFSKPIIREPILGGRGQISGSFTAEEAHRLTERLASGAGKLEFEVVD